MPINSDNLTIRAMTTADTAFAVEMTDIEKWGNLRSDFERLVALEPKGCFVACYGDRPVGMISSIRYGDFAFLGSLIVRQSERGQGIGGRLMRHAMAHLKATGVRTIELDGEMRATPLYRRLGFVDKYLSLRFVRPAGGTAALGTGEDVSGKILGQKALKEIIAFDRKQTGLDRSRLLQRFGEEFPESAFVAGEGNIRAYGFVRPVAGGYAIGPLVSSDTESTRTILKVMLTRFGDQGLQIGVPEARSDTKANQVATDLLLEYGFTARPPSLRMYLGSRRDYERAIFGIFSPEKG